MSDPSDPALESYVDYGLGGLGVPDVPDVPDPFGPLDPAGNDQVAFNAMVSLLSGTRAWQSVRHATLDEVLYPESTSMPFCAIVPRGGNDVDLFDHGVFLRTVNYTLVLVHHDQEPLARKALLGSLEAIARNTLAGRSYGGFCLPVWSRLGQAQHPRPAHPEQRVEIPGSFAYLVDGFAGRDPGTYYDMN